MKKHLLCFCMASLTVAFAQAQIFNNDLEIWTVKSYDVPGGAFTHAFGKVTKTTDKHSGSFAIKLEGNPSTGQTGGIMIGEFGNGPNLIKGIPFAAKPDSLVFWSKSSIATKDTANVYLSFFKNGSRISNQFFYVLTSNANYTRLAYKINYTISGQTPDSVTMFISSTSSNIPNPLSWIQIDDISFVGTSVNIPNPGFETWSIRNKDVPKDWWNPYDEQDLFENTPNRFEKTNDKATGEYAILVRNTFNSKDSVWGQTQTGSDNWWGWPAFPVSGKQDTLYGLYKWFPDKKDSWSVYIMMYKAGKQIGNGNIVASDSQSSYAIFKFPINYWTMDIPDSAVIQLSSYGPNGAKGNSKLYIDNLNFNRVYGVGVDPVSKKNSFVVYPNPAQDQLHIVLPGQNQGSVFRIMNAAGQLVKEISCTGEVNRVDIRELPAGNYMILKAQTGAMGRFMKK